MSKRMEIYAHRGCSGDFPENTMVAFQAACATYADGIELDVQLTKDGELVVIHDEQIDRTTNGTGFVKDIPFNQLKLYDAGSWFHPHFSNEAIPSLREVLELIKSENPAMKVNIELKNDVFPYEGMERKVLACIKETEMMDRVIISSFNSISLKKFSELNAPIEQAFLFEGMPANIVKKAEISHADALHCEASFAMSPEGSQAIGAGYPLRVFTINSEDQLNELKAAGVSAIMTDFPERFLE